MIKKILFFILFIIFSFTVESCPGDGDCTPSKNSKNYSVDDNKTKTSESSLKNLKPEADNNSSFSIPIDPNKKNYLDYINQRVMLEQSKNKKIFNLEKLNVKINNNYHSNYNYIVKNELNDINKFINNNELSKKDKIQINKKLINLNNSIIDQYINQNNLFQFSLNNKKEEVREIYNFTSEYLVINDIIKTLEILNKNNESKNFKESNIFQNTYNDFNQFISNYKKQISVNEDKLNYKTLNEYKKNKLISQNNFIKNQLEQLDYAKKLNEIMK